MSWLSKTLGLDPVRSSYRNTQQDALRKTGTLETPFRNIAAGGAQTSAQFRPQRNQTGQALLNRYSRPFDESGVLKKKLLGGIDGQFSQIASQTRAAAPRSGQRAMSTLALLGAKKAQATSQALQDFEAQRLAEEERRMRGAYQTAQELAAMGLSEEQMGLGRLADLYRGQFGMAGDIATAEEAAANANREMIGGLLGTSASLLGGAGVFGGASRAVAPAPVSRSFAPIATPQISTPVLPDVYAPAPMRRNRMY